MLNIAWWSLTRQIGFLTAFNPRELRSLNGKTGHMLKALRSSRTDDRGLTTGD